jgi:hypothetical protein
MTYSHEFPNFDPATTTVALAVALAISTAASAQDTGT